MLKIDLANAIITWRLHLTEKLMPGDEMIMGSWE